MNREKRELDYPTELESQIILRLPEEPAKYLHEILKNGDSLKNRLTIKIENDMRQAEVKLDDWMMHAKIVDLPTVVESLKTIDNKSFYKTADVCQMMICKKEPDQPPSVEEESPAKNKKKDPYKVDKKFLWPHGITPPTKNVRRRRFRKTLKKKYVEAPEIEKEVKRLLRADNEADSVTWELIEDDKQPTKVETVVKTPVKSKKKQKQECIPKRELKSNQTKPLLSSRVVDIFGEAISDSDLEEDNTNIANAELEDNRMSAYDSLLSDTNLSGSGEPSKRCSLPEQFSTLMFEPTQGTSKSFLPQTPSTSGLECSAILSSGEEGDNLSQDSYKDNMNLRIEQARTELEELKQRRLRTQNEIARMDNLALRQRFQETLHTLNQDIMHKEMEYQGMITLQNSEDI